MAGGKFYVDFKVPELKKALDQISTYDGKTRLKIEQAVSDSTKAISKGAKSRVPVRTGRLKQTIGSRFEKKYVTGFVSAGKYNGSGLVAALKGGGAPYAHLVEFGHRGAKIKPKNAESLSIGGNFAESAETPRVGARPFMRPAYETEKPNLIKNITEAVKPK